MDSLLLTISKLKRWSINYYIDTANTAQRATADLQRANGGLGEYYTEYETRTPAWLLAGDTHRVAVLTGLTDVQRAGGAADPAVVARWLDDGVAPNGARGRRFGVRGVHGFDLTFGAPKSVSLLRALRADEVVGKGIAAAHTTALSEAMEYLAQHAGYTRVHNPVTEEKDLVRLPGLVAIAYQHETSRCGDPHLHTHVIVPNRQARADGVLVSLDGTSLYHEAKAAGVIYQATLRRELHQSLGFEWAPVDPATGMAEVAGVDRATITAWSRRSSQLRDWAAQHLAADGQSPTSAELATAQKATRPGKPEELAWSALQAQWRVDARGLRLDRAPVVEARAARRAAARVPFDSARLAHAAAHIEKAAFTRADLIEIIGAQLPIDGAQTPRAVVEAAVDDLGVRLTGPRAAHQREGHERFTLEVILAEEAAVLDLVDARDDRARLWALDERDPDTAALSAEQARAVRRIAESPWLVQPLSAPAGAGKTTSMRALRAAAERCYHRVLVLAPTGQAVDVALREGAGDQGYTIAKALQMLGTKELQLRPNTLVVVDEAGMVGTDDLRRLLTATTQARIKTVLVGDAHQLAPVKARGGMFDQLQSDLPWTQQLSEVWRMHDPQERTASLALRDGDPAAVARAARWYQRENRLHAGDQIAMATDALSAYRADVAAGKDAMLVCDTNEMADALNQRLHNDIIAADADTVSAARGHAIAVGDLILTRRNDPTIELYQSAGRPTPEHVVRNGNRWRVIAVDPPNHGLAAQRLSDGAHATLEGDYLREHVTLGYAATVHTAQGATADTTHAVLGDTTTRNLLYVAMTRGRDTNTAYLYERPTEHEYAPAPDASARQLWRAAPDDAAHTLQNLIAHTDETPVTAHDYATRTPNNALPEQVQDLMQQRQTNIQQRQIEYGAWRQSMRTMAEDLTKNRARHASRSLHVDEGLEL
ncbi:MULTISPECIES: MobF family relaxase [unclassified Mycobacterium]|uniref:MobF family relaxase n=1 Tax=unclassified Mycobacterium TaxID=2642494 RepID=UPI0029C97EF9|nr:MULTISPECIES: MobF family relaxase [unclassified Mycobacterium]